MSTSKQLRVTELISDDLMYYNIILIILSSRNNLQVSIRKKMFTLFLTFTVLYYRI